MPKTVLLPTPAQIKQARAVSGLSQARSAKLVCVVTRTWEKWEAGNQAMPAGLFELFLIKTGQHHDYREIGNGPA